jgi:multicomponent Na+:H+ antiporter subunit F
MKFLTWLIGFIILALVFVWIFTYPFSFLVRCLYVLILSSLLCLYRVLRGPTAADRAVSVDILGVLIIGFCAVLALATGRQWYLDIGIAWGLQSFIGMLALAKYLEGRSFDD